MLERMLLVAAGLAIGAPLSVVAMWVGRRLSLLDRPGAIKPHARPTPYTGGAALLAVITVGGIALNAPLQILVGAAAAWLVGFADDYFRLPPAAKLAGTVVPLVIGATAFRLDPRAAVAAILAGVILVNAFNVIDGLDGLAGGVALFALLPVVLVGNTFATFSAIALGAVMGFLILNLHPARLFMGDEGSLLLGYLLWILALSLVQVRPLPASVLFAGFIWTFPIVNAVFVLIRRARERRALWIGDRSHLYDVLNRRYGLRTAVTICWTIAAAGSTLAAALQY